MIIVRKNKLREGQADSGQEYNGCSRRLPDYARHPQRPDPSINYVRSPNSFANLRFPFLCSPVPIGIILSISLVFPLHPNSKSPFASLFLPSYPSSTILYPHIPHPSHYPPASLTRHPPYTPHTCQERWGNPVEKEPPQPLTYSPSPTFLLSPILSSSPCPVPTHVTGYQPHIETFGEKGQLGGEKKSAPPNVVAVSRVAPIFPSPFIGLHQSCMRFR